MVYVDVPFPDRIAFGAQSDPMWETTVVASIGGQESTNQHWSYAKHAYDVSFAVRTAQDYLLIREHFHQVRGRARKFPFKDYLDFRVSSADGVLLDAAGGLQLHRRYGAGADAYDRKITRPVSGTVTVFRTRLGVTSNATADATIDHATGLVQMAGGESDDTYTWSGEFVVPCRYDVDRLPAIIANKQPGAAGELLVRCEAIPIVEVRE